MTIKPLYLALLAGAVSAALVPVVRRRIRNRREAAATPISGNRSALNQNRSQSTSIPRPSQAGASTV